MGDLTRLADTRAINPVTGGVWRVEKKRKPADRQRQNAKRDRRKRGERKRGDPALAEPAEKMNESTSTEMPEEPSPGEESENQLGYGLYGSKKGFAQKIDLII